jgi:hypothetical protein
MTRQFGGISPFDIFPSPPRREEEAGPSMDMDSKLAAVLDALTKRTMMMREMVRELSGLGEDEFAVYEQKVARQLYAPKPQQGDFVTKQELRDVITEVVQAVLAHGAGAKAEMPEQHFGNAGVDRDPLTSPAQSHRAPVRPGLSVDDLDKEDRNKGKKRTTPKTGDQEEGDQ